MTHPPDSALGSNATGHSAPQLLMHLPLSPKGALSQPLCLTKAPRASHPSQGQLLCPPDPSTPEFRFLADLTTPGCNSLALSLSGHVHSECCQEAQGAGREPKTPGGPIADSRVKHQTQE